MVKPIEEEIHQRKFNNEYHKMKINVIYTGSWVESELNKVFKKYGLSLPQYNILRILKGSSPNPLCLHEIKERMLDRMSDTSRIVERLAKAGYLERSANEADRRSINIQITKKGIDLINSMSNEVDALDDAISVLTEEEAVQLNNLLNKVRVNKKEQELSE